ncbi:hypothetical protein BDV3_002658 [Batrachochytrium dendrobatidis]|uniref:Uncharacterized protein n=1 Tax=Batrachochytrium dendrobatidis (strain JEL423) TaxID=403673 RepID=A0A177WVX5_BATDL|nr:hypothetical protein BDEG_27362 [Batrachochytrium dendrobatidis JEL423]
MKSTAIYYKNSKTHSKRDAADISLSDSGSFASSSSTVAVNSRKNSNSTAVVISKNRTRQSSNRADVPMVAPSTLNSVLSLSSKSLPISIHINQPAHTIQKHGRSTITGSALNPASVHSPPVPLHLHSSHGNHQRSPPPYTKKLIYPSLPSKNLATVHVLTSNHVSSRTTPNRTTSHLSGSQQSASSKTITGHSSQWTSQFQEYPTPKSSSIQSHDRAVRKIMDLEIANTSLFSINSALERTVRQQSILIQHLKKKMASSVLNNNELESLAIILNEELSVDSSSTLAIQDAAELDPESPEVALDRISALVQNMLTESISLLQTSKVVSTQAYEDIDIAAGSDMFCHLPANVPCKATKKNSLTYCYPENYVKYQQPQKPSLHNTQMPITSDLQSN